MHNSTFRMGNDPIYIMALFGDIEELFRIFGVPNDMKVQLTRSFLNETASALLIRLDSKNANDYNSVKEYSTHQLEPSPRFYLEHFKSHCTAF
jgi:hypothetical protein